MVMNYESCSCEQRRCNCPKGIMVLAGILAGIVFTVIGVLLFNNGLITDITPVAWTALVSGLVYLFVLIGIIASDGSDTQTRCRVRRLLPALLVGIFGTIFTSIIAVASTLTAGAVYAIIIAALLFFFFAYMIVSTLFLLKED